MGPVRHQESSIVLLRGDPGSGKTFLAHRLKDAWGRPLVLWKLDDIAPPRPDGWGRSEPVQENGPAPQTPVLACTGRLCTIPDGWDAVIELPSQWAGWFRPLPSGSSLSGLFRWAREQGRSHALTLVALGPDREGLAASWREGPLFHQEIVPPEATPQDADGLVQRLVAWQQRRILLNAMPRQNPAHRPPPSRQRL